MEPNKEVERRHIVVDTPGVRREVVTETRQEVPRESGMSAGTIATIAGIALLAIGITYYVVNNKNANEEANRQVAMETSRAQTQQQPATAPIIVQQPAPAQQAPVIIQQPAPVVETSSPLDDQTIQDAATKRLTDDPGLASLTVTVSRGRATLMGSVHSVDLKSAAESTVKAVQGVKSVDNRIEVTP